MTTTVGAPLSLLEDASFVREAIWPLMARDDPRPLEPPPSTLVRRRRPDGRLVAEIAFPGGERAFAKLYPEVASAVAAHEIHRRLWAGGLGRAPHLVPEPLGLLPDHGVLVLSAAEGEQLEAPPSGSLEGFRAAGRWLAALHGSGADPGASEDEAQGVLRLARRAAAATAVRPELEEVVRALLDVLAERWSRVAAGAERAPTHGRFSAEHVYVAPGSVTAVDLDRAALADPAKDAGELLHRLRWNAGKRRGRVPEDVDAAGEAFVREYLRSSRFALATLEYHWSFSIVWTLLVLASKHRPGKGWEERSGFLLAELGAVPRRCDALLA